MTDKELMQMALDVMLTAIKSGDWKVDGACDPDYVLEALRARLAQPEPEPVAWGCEFFSGKIGHFPHKSGRREVCRRRVAKRRECAVYSSLHRPTTVRMARADG